MVFTKIHADEELDDALDRIQELEQQLADAKKWQSRYVDQKEANIGLVKREVEMTHRDTINERCSHCGR